MDNLCRRRRRRRRKMCIPRVDVDDTSGDGGGSSDPRVENTRSDDDCHEYVIPLPGTIPNVTIAEFGSIEPGNIHAIQAEIYARYGEYLSNLDHFACFKLHCRLPLLTKYLFC